MRDKFSEKWLGVVMSELILGMNGWEFVGVDGCELLFWEKWVGANAIGWECVRVDGGAGGSG